MQTEIMECTVYCYNTTRD